MPPNSAENVVALPVAVPTGPARKQRGRSYELEFLPAAVEILETPASPLGRSIALALALVVAIALLWASIGEIDIVAVAPGKIVPIGRTKTVQAPALNPGESGVVKTIIRDTATPAAIDTEAVPCSRKISGKAASSAASIATRQ